MFLKYNCTIRGLHAFKIWHARTFDLIINPFKYKCKICLAFIHLFQKVVVSAKCNLWIIDLTHSNEWLNSYANVNNSKDVKILLTYSNINVKD